MIHYPLFTRTVPEPLHGLDELARDLRWSTGCQAKELWSRLDPGLWHQLENPVLLMQNISNERLQRAGQDREIVDLLHAVQASRARSLLRTSYYESHYSSAPIDTIAYFSMEYGLGESLPLYAGGLGLLAGDHLKTASDMGIPITGIGILYDRGYFEQMLTSDGWQVEANPYNDPTSLPIEPAMGANGEWLRINLRLPGRVMWLRVWQARVGRITLYLLDSNDPLNSPWDRALTDRLYEGGGDHRLSQELVLGIGGWQMCTELGLHVDVCHMNEGHAAFVVIARAHAFMEKHKVSFHEALRATRAGNCFTTHTPVAAGFDRFDPGLVRYYMDALKLPIRTEDIVDLGMESGGMFNMAFLAARGSNRINGVSRLHGSVSKPIFASVFPRCAVPEVPVGYVTNAVHTESWQGPDAETMWSDGDGEAHDKWSDPDRMPSICTFDAGLFERRERARAKLVTYVRERLKRQRALMCVPDDQIEAANTVLDPKVLTLGFARRFAPYKRPTLLLRDIERLSRILNNPKMPVQIIIAGKAHPGDDHGKTLVQSVIKASRRPDLIGKMVYIGDYDIALTSHLASGVDVWINTPMRPMEASGTSGMKLLVNGGLNLSELDGWWAEAYSPEVGWAIGDGLEHPGEDLDGIESSQLYSILENEIVPEFYDRNANGLPERWLKRLCASMGTLAPMFSGPRMLKEYLDGYYVPAAIDYNHRAANGGRVALDLEAWSARVESAWPQLEFGILAVDSKGSKKGSSISVMVTLGSLSESDVRVQLYADPLTVDGEPTVIDMVPVSQDKETGGRLFSADVPNGRPAGDYTPRIIPRNAEMRIPSELSLIRWYR
jgi:starch phosphorylase